MRPLFSDRAKFVMLSAEDHARRLKHEFIGTEHLLLGLLAESSGEIADLLRGLGVERASVEMEIETLVQPGTVAPSTRTMPLTPRAMAALHQARQEA